MTRTVSSASMAAMMWLLLLLIAMPSGYGQTQSSYECGGCTKKYLEGLLTFDCFQVPVVPSIFYGGCSFKDIQVMTIIGSTGLSQLRSSDLADHKELKKFTITSSHLAVIYEGAFNGLQLLDYLDLSKNQLTSLDFGLFSGNPALTQIKLQGNKLTSLSGHVNLPKLQILDLSSNKLTTLRPDMFFQAGSLRQLNLDTNHLQSIPVSVLSPLSSLHTLTVKGNSWFCDCKNRETFDLLSKDSKLSTALDDFVCTHPSVYNGTSWRKMKENDVPFACHKIVRVVTVIHQANGEELQDGIINVPRGYNVTLGCQIEADPDKPGYSWRWKNGKDIQLAQDKYYVANSTLNSTTHLFWYNLTILNINPRDSETYECHIIDDPRLATSEFVQLKVDGDNGALPVKTGKVWLWVVVGVLALLVVTMVMIIFVVFVRPRFGRRVTTIPYDSKPSPTVAEKSKDTTDSVSAPLLNMNTSTLSSAHSTVGHPRLHSTMSNGSTTLPSPRVHLVRRAPTPDLLYGPPRSASVMHEPYQFAYASFDPRRRPLRPNGFTPIHPPDNRLNSRFGSMTSIISEPVARVPAGLGYVTLPRRARNPSWSHSGMANGYPRTPLSPTGSLPPPMRTYRYPPFGPELQTVPDGVGPRRTADGGSNLSLNQVGLKSPAQVSTSRPPSRSGFITPITPITPSSARPYKPYGVPSNIGGGRTARSRTPIGNNMYESLPSNVFTFEPLPEDEGPVDFSEKAPPVVPPKPKRVSTIVEEVHVPDLESIKGTEV